MELPSQSGLTSPKYTDSEDDEAVTRAQMRKNNKPLLEKKRRARINSSLEQLKSLVLDALKKDSARYSKLEKADILEMTVKHLRELQRQQMAAAMTIDPTVMAKYQNGFGECAQEVQRYLGSIDGLSSEVRVRLMHHLSNCMNQVRQVPSYGGIPVYAGVPCASPSQTLPGLGVRPLLPFGGLAMTSSDCPGLRISPSSTYNCADRSLSDGAFSPKCKPCEARSAGSLDNRENIAPCAPLVDCYRLDSAAQCPADDDNNNHVCLPPTKRRKVETQRDPCGHQNRNQQHANNIDHNIDHNIGHNLFDVVKSESVWRPW